MTKEMIVNENTEVLKDSGGAPLIFEVEPGYEIGLIELPGNYGVEEFFRETKEVPSEDELVSKPYPSEHACRHAAPSKFEKFRSGSRSSGGKKYRIIFGKVKNVNRWEEASYRYNVNSWTAAEARKHCREHNGIAFEAAVAKTTEESEAEGFNVKKTDELRRLVYGIYLEPNIVDKQGDIEDGLEIEKAAHRYMLRLWKDEKPEMLGSEHEMPITDALVVESYIAPTTFWFDGTPHDEAHKVHKGSWVVCALIADEIEFNKVLDGDYTGFSIQGHGRRKPL